MAEADRLALEQLEFNDAASEVTLRTGGKAWKLNLASYELQPDCQPVPYRHPDFERCHRDVGDFPEVDLGLKGIYTRILTAFGAGLVPIL